MMLTATPEYVATHLATLGSPAGGGLPGAFHRAARRRPTRRRT